MQRTIIPKSIFVICDLVVKKFWDMQKESKYNRNTKRQAECSCSIPEKDITNLASRAVQEGKGTHNSNLQWLHEQQSIETAECCSRNSVPQDRHGVEDYKSNTKPLQSSSNHEKQLWLQPVKDLPLNLVDKLSADYSDRCWNLTSGKDDCLQGGMTTVPWLAPWGFATAGQNSL